ncbi:MAG TPA: response regulator [Anaerolineae bacterium]|nr:response regulator [Anaerolineae bacterium]
MSAGEERIRVLIVDDIPETRENLKKMLYFESDMEIVGTASSGDEAIELSKQTKPHVVLMDINMPGVDGIAASEAITRAVPHAQIVMMSVQSEADYLRRSMLAGARDFLTKPFSMDELISTVRRVYEVHAKPAAAMPAVQAAVPEATAHRPGSLGKVVLVYSPKGGVGCTTLAINLATMMCQLEPEARVALLDASLQFGDVGVLLNLRATRSIVDLADNPGDLDEELLESALLTDDRSGLKVLLAPPKPEMAELVTLETMRRAIELMKRSFDYLVIDMGKRLQDLELSLFDLADRVVLVIAPDLPAIKDARHFFELMEALEHAEDKMLLVLNKADSNVGITTSAIENHLRHKVFAEIPRESRIVLHSVNHGVPYVLIPNLDRRHPLVEQTKAFAERLLEAFAEEAKEGGEPPPERPLRRLFR